jgi:predicted RND superfamily exporter protein
VVRLSTAFEGLEQVRRVDSLDTVPLIRARPGGELRLDPPLAEGVPETSAARRRLGAEVLADRVAPRNLVSDDGRVFAVNLLLEAGTRDGFLELVENVRSQVDPTRSWVSGVPVFRTEINTQTREELFALVPLTVGVIGALLFIVFRSLYAMVLPLAVGLIGTVVMIGAMGAMGASITLLTMILPSIVLALGCAYAMHVLAAAQGQRELAGLRAALERVSLPVMLSGLTTAIGFASIGAVRIDAVREAGGYGAVGVLATLAATLTLVPACLGLRRLPRLRPRFAGLLEGRVCEALVALATRWRGLALLAWALAIVPFSLGLAGVDVATDATSWFPPGTRPRDEYDAIREALSGISPVNVVIESRDGRPVTDPDLVEALDRLSSHLESFPEVGKAVSLADPLRQMHGGFSGDSALPLPDSRALIEQYLLLLESVESISDLVTDDRSAANIVLRVDDNRSGALRGVATAAEAWWAEHAVPGFEARGTGTMFEFARAEDEITFGQIRGLGIAILAIGLVLWMVFRGPGLAGIALVPNAVPVVAVYGFMGLAGIALDAGTVMVGSLALGIAVDDTMHVATSLHEARERGVPSTDALAVALRSNLPALTYTTVVIALGFGILGLSDFTFIRNLGLLISAVMVVCLAADVTLFPALWLRAKRPAAADADRPA